MGLDGLQETMLSFLEKIVGINSDSGNSEGIRGVISACEPLLRQAGLNVEVIAESRLIAKRQGVRGPRVLILGHMDTYRPMEDPVIELKREGPILKGHGVSDMKAGLVAVIFGLGQLAQAGALQDSTVTVLFNSDEETGSTQSRQLIEDEARQHDLVLVFEGGKRVDEQTTTFVIERQGLCSARYVFDKVDAGSEAVHAGIPRDFHLEFPFKDAQDIEKTRSELEHAVEKTRDMHREYGKASPSRIEISICRPPMIPTGRTLEYAAVLEKIGRHIGHPVIARTRPGMSDGCFTAALGIPTLDGLGPVGTNWHTKDEYLEIPTLQKRVELFVNFWKTIFTMEHATAGGLTRSSPGE